MLQRGEFKPQDFDVLSLLYQHSAVMVSSMRNAKELLPTNLDTTPFHSLFESTYNLAHETLLDLGGENAINNYERIAKSVLNNHKIFFFAKAFITSLSLIMQCEEYSRFIALYKKMQDLITTILSESGSLQNLLDKRLNALESFNNTTTGIHSFFNVHLDWNTRQYKEEHLNSRLTIMKEEFLYAISRMTELDVTIDNKTLFQEISAKTSYSLMDILNEANAIKDVNKKQEYLEKKLQLCIAEIEVAGTQPATAAKIPAIYSKELALNNLEYAYSKTLMASLAAEIKKLNKIKKRELKSCNTIEKIWAAFQGVDMQGESEHSIEKIRYQSEVQISLLDKKIRIFKHHLLCCKKFLKDLEDCGKLFDKVEHGIHELYENALLTHASKTHSFIHYFLQDNIQKIKLALPLSEFGDNSLVFRKRYGALCVLLSNVKRSIENDKNTPEALIGYFDDIISDTHIDPDKDFPDEFALGQSLNKVFYDIPQLKNSLQASVVKAWYQANYSHIQADILAFMTIHPAANHFKIFQLLKTLKASIVETDDVYMQDRNNQFFAVNYYGLGSKILSVIKSGLAVHNKDNCIEVSRRLSTWSQAINQYGIFSVDRVAEKIGRVADAFSSSAEKISSSQIALKFK